MYAMTALPAGPHAAPAADETAAGANAPAAPDAALTANSGAAASAAAPSAGEPAPEGSDFGDVLQREQQAGTPASSGAATPAPTHGRAGRHHDAHGRAAGSLAASPAAGVPLPITVAAGVTTTPSPLALRPHGEGDGAAERAEVGDDQVAGAGRLGSGQERGYAASGTGMAWSPERTLTLSTNMESQPQLPVVAANALAAAGTTARQASGAATDGSAGAPHLGMGQPHEGDAPGHMIIAPVMPVEGSLDTGPAASTLPGDTASVPAYLADAKVVMPGAPVATEAAHDRAANTAQTGEQLDAAIAAAVADLATAAGTKLATGTTSAAAPRAARDRASGSGQALERDAAPVIPGAQPHGVQAAGSLPQATLPHASIQATHDAAGETTAHTDGPAAGVRHGDAAPHSEGVPQPSGRVFTTHDQTQQSEHAATMPAGPTTVAPLMVGNTAPAERAVGAAPDERSTSAPAQHGAPSAVRHDAVPTPQGGPTGSAAALQALTLPGVTTPTSVSGGRLPATGTRPSGVETALHRAAGVASGTGADASIAPLRPHTAASATSASAPFALPQTLSAATGAAPAHHAAPKETTATSGVLAPVAEGIFVRLGALRTTPSSSSFHVVLQPQALGTVSVHVERGQDGLQVTLIPQQSATREILDRHMHELVSALGAADGVAPRVSVVAPGAAPSGGFNGADQGMLGSGGFSADSGGQQSFQGQGAQGEPSSWDDNGRAPVMPAPVRPLAANRAPLASQRLGNASRVDFQA